MRGLTFSWKRFLGISKARMDFARTTGIPTTKNGFALKIGRTLLKMLK